VDEQALGAGQEEIAPSQLLRLPHAQTNPTCRLTTFDVRRDGGRDGADLLERLNKRDIPGHGTIAAEERQNRYPRPLLPEPQLQQWLFLSAYLLQKIISADRLGYLSAQPREVAPDARMATSQDCSCNIGTLPRSYHTFISI
jgi:hypothetical protein